MLVFSAAFAFFAVAGIAVIGFLAFAFFWAKAKISGKPFGPKAMSLMDGQWTTNDSSLSFFFIPDKPASCGLLIFGL